MLGMSVKVWRLGWDSAGRQFQAADSSVFVFQDRAAEDLSYIQAVIRHLAGDASLDGVFSGTLGILNGLPPEEEEAKKEPKGEVAEPMVKLETDDIFDTNGNEAKESFINDDDEDDEDEEDDSDYNDDDDDKYDDGKEMEDYGREVETCDGCAKTYQVRGHFRKHLEACNPEQIETLRPKYTLKQKQRMKTEDGRSQKQSVEKRLVTLAKTAEACSACGRTFKHRSFLIHHLKNCNPEQIPELVQQKMSKKVARRMKAILSDESTLSCSFCPRKFTFKKSLEKHETLHQTDPDSPKLDPTKIRKYNPSAVRVPMGNYQCDKCSSSFKLYAALERHMEAHMLAATARPEDRQDELADRGIGLKINQIRDGVMMRCVRCDLVYSTRGMYEQHMKQYHSKEMACEECGQCFTFPNSLNTHRLNHHTSFPKDCEDCEQNCATKKDFQDHMKTVHGQGGPDARVPCDICGKLVTNKYFLKSHVKLVHEKVGANFPCDKCGKILKSKGSLDYHSKVHMKEYKFRCDECGHGYMRFDLMQDCKNTHAGIYRFNCPHCEYKTNKKQGLANHITTHSAAKPWICPICQHTSSTTSNLGNHIKKVHKMGLCQAEAVTKRSRYGRDMTEDEIEQNLSDGK